MHKIEEIKKLKDRFMGIATSALDQGAENVCTEEMGEVVDMIKDLANAEKDCMEAKYFEEKICLLKLEMAELLEGDDMGEDNELEEMMVRRGYRGRSRSTGRFVSRSNPSRDSGGSFNMSGTHSTRGYDDGNRGGSRSDGMGNRGNDGNRSGVRGYDGGMYPMDPDVYGPYMTGKPMGTSRHGKAYDEWDKYRRNYTDSHSLDDKKNMEHHAKEHIDGTIESMKEMWRNSDPELRKKMKSEITNLLSEMN